MFFCRSSVIQYILPGIWLLLSTFTSPFLWKYTSPRLFVIHIFPSESCSMALISLSNRSGEVLTKRLCWKLSEKNVALFTPPFRVQNHNTPFLSEYAATILFENRLFGSAGSL